MAKVAAKKPAVKKAVKVAAPVGRPTKYKPEYAELAYKFCLLGATDKRLAELLQVSERSVNEWKEVYPEFSQSIANGREIADAEIASSLYHRAKGYEHPEVDIKVIQNQIVKTRLIKHYPPDTTAASLWLRNRQGGKWRDKTEQEVTSTVILQTEEQRLSRIDELLNKANGT
jgi:hypothetical protein